MRTAGGSRAADISISRSTVDLYHELQIDQDLLSSRSRSRSVVGLDPSGPSPRRENERGWVANGMLGVLLWRVEPSWNVFLLQLVVHEDVGDTTLQITVWVPVQITI